MRETTAAQIPLCPNRQVRAGPRSSLGEWRGGHGGLGAMGGWGGGGYHWGGGGGGGGPGPENIYVGIDVL